MPTNLTVEQVKALAFEHGLSVKASAVCPGLAGQLEANADLRAAWSRGVFLYRLRIAAGTTDTIHQAGARLGMDGKSLRDLLDGDPEARAVWTFARDQLRRDLAEGLLTRVKAGEKSACVAAERFLRAEEPAGAGFDFERVPMATMVAITGRSRQAISAWVRRSGCQQNPDATFDLKAFLVWYLHRERTLRDSQRLRTTIRAAVRAELAEVVNFVRAQTQGSSQTTESR